MNKFKTKDLDVLLKDRAKDKMGRLKELMLLHMTSPNDAFRFVSFNKLYSNSIYSLMRPNWENFHIKNLAS